MVALKFAQKNVIENYWTHFTAQYFGVKIKNIKAWYNLKNSNV